MGCHISTSALYTKRGSQTWSLRLHPSLLIYHSFTSVLCRTTRNPVNREQAAQQVSRAPKHFMSHRTRQEVKAVIRKFSRRSENTRVLPHCEEPVRNNNSNRKREKVLQIFWYSHGPRLGCKYREHQGQQVAGWKSLWAMGSREFQSHRVGREQQGEGKSCGMKLIRRDTSEAERACGQAISALFWDSLTPGMYMERLKSCSFLSCCIHPQQVWVERYTQKTFMWALSSGPGV